MNPKNRARVIVTIDGPAGSGKSTVARAVAARLGMYFLDTGAMYRAVAAAVLDAGLDPADAPVVAGFAERLHLRFGSEDPPRLKVDGIDMTHRLRDADVTRAVSDIAANRQVRELLVRAQRWIGRQHQRLITEGRDQGSVVFTEATLKFYLDATPHVRASRRARQLRQAGRQVDEPTLLRQIIERDRRDRTRPDGPLVCPEDAIRIDTSDMTLEEVISTLIESIGRIAESAGERPA